MQTIEEVLGRINLKTLGLDGYQVLGLLNGGMNNVNYLISAHNKKYIVYIPTPHCNDLVDRIAENDNLDEILPLNISNVNIYHDVATGIKINTYIEGVSLDKSGERPYKQVAAVLKKLHQSTIIKFYADYKPFPRLDNYEKQTQLLKQPLDEKYFALKKEFLLYRPYLEKQPRVPAHNDPQPSNWVQNDEGLYVIDFEFAANNDYIYDIACFGNLDFKDALKLLEAYDGGQVLKDHLQRLYLWRIYQCLQWYLVALIKYGSGLNELTTFDFKEVAKHYLELAGKMFQDFKKL